MIVVSDTSPLLSLIYLNQLHLLSLLFKEVIIPVGVETELLNSRISDEQKQYLKNQKWVRVQSPENLAEVSRIVSRDIHLAEAQAIVLAKELHADYLLIDEQLGRAVASSEGLLIVGVLGVLLRAKKENHIAAIKPMMDVLIAKTGFWISEPLYKRVLQLAGEV